MSGSKVLWFWKTSRGIRVKSVVNVLIGLISVGLDFMFIWSTKLAIDIATGKDDHPLILASCLLVGVMTSTIVMAFARRWVSALLGVKSQNLMQLRTFSRLMHSVWTGMEKRHSGDVLNRLIGDANEITTVITDTIPSAICTLVRMTGAFMYLYSMDHMLAFALIFIAPIFFALSKLYVKKMRTLTREIRDTDSRIQSILQESLQHRAVLKTLEQTDSMISQLANTQDYLRRQVRHKTLFSSTSVLIVNIGFSMGYLVTFLWGVNRLHDGTITYGMMLAFIQLVGQIQGPFRQMTSFVPAMIGALSASDRMMELEDTPLEEEGEPILFDNGAGIRIQNVGFTYEDGQRNILNGFSYDFLPGSTTAILGETGAGKTTLIRMILALLKPTRGTVEFYGTDKYGNAISAEASPRTRCNLVYVPQGNTLMSGTIRENLLLGNPEATDEELIEVLHLACADFVLRREDGLDTLCGEGGAGLSEGQAQRIAIARALLRQGNILLLDEATSALDAVTEEKLINNISTLARAKRQTILFITHREAVLNYCHDTITMERSC